MNSMASADPVADFVFVVAPHNSYPVMPGDMSQASLCPNNQPQGHLIPGNPPVLMPSVNDLSAHKVLKEGKVLGAIQILIGLVHISLGSVMATVLSGSYIPVSFYGGFPFWGGIWFIISGSLLVAAENQPNSTCLLNGSVGLNIFSVICSAVGIILFITDLSLVGTYTDYGYYSRYDSWGVNPGMAVSGVLLIFCLLEFCVACTSSHFGCKLACCQYNNESVVIPNVCAANPVEFLQPSNSIPSYSSIAPGSR
uniref:membrane-spanning 4-domains subfamily A member 8 n=1 Tax=Jaculus jaculus TaxID=51337 RepID=UPI001E1B08E9|nr:membrane-spanning 4-domains subfamily A member 8 [Jaculus jaculus]